MTIGFYYFKQKPAYKKLIKSVILYIANKKFKIKLKDKN